MGPHVGAISRVRAGVRTSREGPGRWQPKRRPPRHCAHSLGLGPLEARTPGHFAQKGHGQTHRDLELGWKESQHQDRDAGWLLSELGTFDRQFQSWQGPATVPFSLAGRYVRDSSLRVNS